MSNEFKIENRPIEGDVNPYDKIDAPQKSPAEFLATVDAILAIPEVHSLRWRQYTPYFNDGDPCEFGVHDLEVKLTTSPEDAGDWEDGYEDSWTLGYYAEKEGRTLPEGLKEAMKLWDPRAFEAVARSNFGDHATVTATREGFSVDFFDHD